MGGEGSKPGVPSSFSGADQDQNMGAHSKPGPQTPDMDKHLQTLKAFVCPELYKAAETLLVNYHHCSRDKNIKGFYDYLTEICKSGAGGPSSSGADQDQTIGVHSKPGPQNHQESSAGPSEPSRGTKRPHVVHVVKVHTVCTGETFGSHKVLMDQVNQSKELQMKKTNQPGCDVVILFCPIVSRAGADVEAAMTEVPADGKVILVLMHHTRKTDYSTCGMIWTDRFPNIISAVHVLYHETVSGLLQCAQNKEAVRQLQEVLKDNSSKSGSSWSFF